MQPDIIRGFEDIQEKNKLIEKIKVIQKSNNIKFDNFLYSKNVNRSLKKFVSYFYVFCSKLYKGG